MYVNLCGFFATGSLPHVLELCMSAQVGYQQARVANLLRETVEESTSIAALHPRNIPTVATARARRALFQRACDLCLEHSARRPLDQCQRWSGRTFTARGCQAMLWDECGS